MRSSATLLVCVFLAAVPSAAQETASPQQPAASQQPSTVAPATVEVSRPIATFEDGHPAFRFGPLRVDLHGRVQTDVTRSDGAVGEASDVDLSRKRIGIEGELGRRLSFEFDAELGDDRVWRDAFLDYRANTAFRVQMGQFKVPFSLEATTSTANIDFVYRSQGAAQLAPGRERGVMVHGRLWRRRLMYEAGTFVPARRHDLDGGLARIRRTAAVRLSSEPFSRSRSPLAELQVGVAATVGTLDEGVSDLKGRTALGEHLFDSIYWVRGERRRIGAEARWEPGPFSLAAEYMRVSDERLGQGLANDDLPPLVARGWYASGTWLVTGESKASGRLPRRSVLQGGVGAIEAAVRVETFRFGQRGLVSDGFPNPRGVNVPESRNRLLTAGVNWYLHRSVKVQANLIREVVDGASGTTAPRTTVLSQVLRLQFTL
jgi:phosphate-selective porin OprO/OprP